MNCMDCKDNYLYLLYKRCWVACNRNIYQAFEMFDRQCRLTGDPRSSLILVNDMTNNDNCDICREYRKYYEEKSEE